jgi:hypothetical protein
MANIDNLHIFLILVLVAVLSVSRFYLIKTKSELNNSNNTINQEIPVIKENIQVVSEAVPLATDIITDYDYRILTDPLKEPGKRPPRHLITPLIGNPHLNIPTRGYPDSFNLQGYLIDNKSMDKHDENKILRLYGRQVYPNSVEWEYYIEVNVGDDKFKFDLDKQKREIFEGDKVYIDILKRNYEVKLMKQKGLEYNPFLW